MKRLTALLLSLISINLYAQTAPAPLDDTTRFMQQVMNQFVQKNGIPGAAVELYVDGKLYEQYFGYADEEKKEPIMRKTIFEIGSISKVMTCILFAQEIDWAKMALNDPLSKYVKGLSASFNKIKLQDLATHTSGLPFNPPADINTKEQLQQYLSQWSTMEVPGDDWRYSNFGIGMLGRALESSTESDYGDLYRRHILNPLKMVNGVTVPPALTKYYAQGHDSNGYPVDRVDAGFFPAASGIKASAADMQRFLSAAIGLKDTPPRVFYPIRFTQSIFLKVNDEYQGLSWKIHAIANQTDINNLLNVSNETDFGPIEVQEVYPRPVYSGNALIDKTGSTRGFRAYIAVIPNKNSGIVILTNKKVPDSAIVRTAREILLKVTHLA